MTVYFEYAFAENVLLDGLLLYLALKCTRGKVKAWRLILSSVLGGIEAVLFPILTLSAWAAYAVKFFGGALIAIIAVSERGFKPHCIVLVAFFAMTFLLGGLLVAAYSFFEIPYLAGEGYLVEGAPISLVLAVSGAFAVVVVRFSRVFYRYRKRRQNILPCKIIAGGKTHDLHGYADSGNRLFFRGEPVCVISAIGALKLFRGQMPVGRMELHTVSGSRESPVFLCEMIEVNGCKKENCYFTVGDISSKEHSLILHTALVEDSNERTHLFKGIAEEVRSK